MGVTGGPDSEESACNAEDPGLVPELGRSPGEGTVFLPGEFFGQRNLADYSPWSHKESNTTEQLTLLLFKDNSGRDFFPHFIHLFVKHLLSIWV